MGGGAGLVQEARGLAAEWWALGKGSISSVPGRPYGGLGPSSQPHPVGAGEVTQAPPDTCCLIVLLLRSGGRIHRIGSESLAESAPGESWLPQPKSETPGSKMREDGGHPTRVCVGGGGVLLASPVSEIQQAGWGPAWPCSPQHPPFRWESWVSQVAGPPVSSPFGLPGGKGLQKDSAKVRSQDVES